MQTFLPHTSFEESAKVLDMKRLGKQRVETMQILSALTGYKAHPEYPEVRRAVKLDKPSQWSRHVVTRMWRGYEAALYKYGMAICNEWVSRGYNDSCKGKITIIARKHFKDQPRIKVVMPPWLNGDIASQYRGILLGKDFDHYSQFGWTEEPLAQMEYPSGY